VADIANWTATLKAKRELDVKQGRVGFDRLSSVGPLARVLSAQVLAFSLISMAGWAAVSIFEWRAPVEAIVISQSLLAMVLSFAFGLRRWWLGVQFALPILAWVFLRLEVPSWLYLAVFVVLLLVYSNVSSERVPLYLSNRTTWAALSHMLSAEKPPTKHPRFVELGCGLGGTIAYLSKMHPDWQFVGVENAPGPYLISRLRLIGRANARVEFKSLWDVDLSSFDVAYAFLSPAPMPRLIERANGEMKGGAVLISNSFWAPDRPYDGAAEVNDGRKTCLFFKRIEKN